eukprot:2192087-Amphidinium_carterae.1
MCLFIFALLVCGLIRKYPDSCRTNGGRVELQDELFDNDLLGRATCQFQTPSLTLWLNHAQKSEPGLSTTVLCAWRTGDSMRAT